MFAWKVILSFIKNEDGAFALVLSMVLFGVMIVGGVALDYSRISNHRMEAQEALDSAVLVAAGSYQADHNKTYAISAAKAYLSSNLNHDMPYSMKLNFSEDEVYGSMQGSTALTLLSVVGRQSQSWSIESAASYSGPGKIEYALAIDISASMENGGHMAALRNGLREFSKAAFDGSKSGDVAVTFIPYANAVAFEPEFSKWLDPVAGLSATGEFSGCFFDEAISVQASISTAQIGKYISTPAMEKTMKSGDTHIFCPKSDTLASFFLTSQGALNSRINAVKSYQGTNTAEALAWAWRALSPDWRATIGKSAHYPRSYKNDEKKAIVLFTDGMPYERPWTEDKVDKAQKQVVRDRELNDFKSVCDAISKDRNIDVFVVAYGRRMTQMERQVLEDCVSGEGIYQEANAANISKVFRAIHSATALISLTR